MVSQLTIFEVAVKFITRFMGEINKHKYQSIMIANRCFTKNDWRVKVNPNTCALFGREKPKTKTELGRPTSLMVKNDTLFKM